MNETEHHVYACAFVEACELAGWADLPDDVAARVSKRAHGKAQKVGALFSKLQPVDIRDLQAQLNRARAYTTEAEEIAGELDEALHAVCRLENKVAKTPGALSDVEIEREAWRAQVRDMIDEADDDGATERRWQSVVLEALLDWDAKRGGGS